MDNCMCTFNSNVNLSYLQNVSTEKKILGVTLRHRRSAIPSAI